MRNERRHGAYPLARFGPGGRDLEDDATELIIGERVVDDDLVVTARRRAEKRPLLVAQHPRTHLGAPTDEQLEVALAAPEQEP